MIVGAGYVQALVTGPLDVGCPPRIHRTGSCVRTPGHCAAAPPCVTRLEVRGGGGELLAGGDSSFVRVSRLPRRASVRIAGCGGELDLELSDLEPVTPLERATAAVSEDALELEWSPRGSADQICGLWSWQADRELCCFEDGGRARFAAPPGIDSVRLSRGRLRARVETAAGAVEVYQTADTDNLIPPE